MANSLDQDQDRPSVGPDLGPNCMQRLLTDDKSRRLQGNSLVSYKLVRDKDSLTQSSKSIILMQVHDGKNFSSSTITRQ